jgi:uncharacterized membrane protein (DUF4010 family)
MHRPVADAGKVSQSFGIKTAFSMAGIIAVVLIVSAGLNQWFGQAGLVIGSAFVGLIDAHAPTVSVASFVANHQLAAVDAVLPILAAFSFNAIAKVIAAIVSGGKVFAWQLVPSLVIQVAAVWMGWLLF